MARPRKQRVDLDIVSSPGGHERRELWEGVADALRDAIVTGSVQAGASLVEADLATRFDVSRGPIRDALRELAREGLIIDLPRRGTVVSTLSFADIQEVYEVREGLEIAAARLAVDRASDGEIDELAVLVDELEAAWARDADYPESLAADLAFHRALVALAGNVRLAASYEQMVAQTQLHAITAARLNPRLRRAMRRSIHRDIVRALRAHDPEATAQAVVDHYAYARERLFAGYPMPR